MTKTFTTDENGKPYRMHSVKYCFHPLESTPQPEPRLIDAAPVIQDLKAMLRKMRPMEDFDAGKRAGIRYALDLLKTEIGEPF